MRFSGTAISDDGWMRSRLETHMGELDMMEVRAAACSGEIATGSKVVTPGVQLHLSRGRRRSLTVTQRQ
ncbi:MAG: hypothetical protein R3D44_09780 [Hyphomicrobiaceae bacterium]